MYHAISEAESQLMFGIHDEWNVRELRVRRLLSGQTYLSWTFRDDGVLHDERQRHPSIPMAFVVPTKVDWPLFKANLFYHLERVKACS